MFPEIERITGEKGLMGKNVAQHGMPVLLLEQKSEY